MKLRNRERVSTQVGLWMPRGSFNPANLSPKLWLDAADASTITSSGSPAKVSQWDDKSANGFHVVQATGAAQPTTGATTQNGFNVLDFDGGDTLTNSTANNFLFTVDGSSYLVAAVWKAGTTDDPNAGYTLIGSSGTSAQTGVLLAFDDRSSASRNNNMFHNVYNAGQTQPVSNVAGNSSHPANTPTVVTLLADPDNATGATRSAIFVGTGGGFRNNTATAAVASSISNTFAVGGTYFSSLVGWIAEIIIVEGAEATEANRLLLRDYLIAKWGL